MSEPAQQRFSPPFGVRDAFLLAVAVGLSAYVYYPITDNYFFGDDFLNLYRIVNEGFVAFVQRPHGGHVLLTRNTLFYLFHALFGTNAEAYFVVVLATHLLNVALLFGVVRLLTGSSRLACFGAALWGVAPCNRGVLGWYSVYGQVVVATCILCVLYSLARLANGRPLRRFAPLGWLLLLLAASTSFGVGIGASVVMPILAYLILPPSPQRWKIVGVFLLIAISIPPLYFGMQWVHVHWFHGNEVALPFLLSGLSYRMYIIQLALHLNGYGAAALSSGPLYDPHHYPGMIGYAAAGVFFLLIVAGALRGSAEARRQTLAFVLLAAGSYGIIAMGRGVFFGTAPLGLIRAERFQYVGPMALALALCAALAGMGRWRAIPDAAKTGLLAAWLLVVGFLEIRVGTPIDHHAAARRETNAIVSILRRRIRSASPGEDLYFVNRPFHGAGQLIVSPTMFPGWAGVFTLFFPANRVDGKQVHFILDDDEAVSIARRGRRTADLIVDPDEVRERNAEPIDLRRRLGGKKRKAPAR